MSDPETVAENVSATIENVIEDAETRAEHAAEVNELLTDAAIEGERGRRIGDLERRFGEWQNNQADQSEAIAALTLGLTQLTGQVQTLLTLAASPTPNRPSGAEDGPPENQEELPPVKVETTVETPEAAAPPAPVQPPARKRRNWI